MESKRRVILYTILVFAFSSVFYYFAIPKPRLPHLFLWLMWCPALASFVTTIITKRPWREYGWKPGPFTYLAKGYYFPLLYAVPAYLIVWLTGLGGFPNHETLDGVRKFLHVPGLSDPAVSVLYLAVIAIVLVPLSLISATGEEIGWRGFLVPELTKWVGFKKAAIISGIIWAVWHMPLIIAGPYSVSGTPRAYQVLCFALMVISIAVAFAWVRMKSGSFWPAAIFHASHNAFIQAYFDRMTRDNGHTNFFIGEFGIMMVPFCIVLAIYCWKRAPQEANATLSASTANP
ncbi:MAG TPA: type II CAAX endopeptidase family protein [Candidatus Koribacter sp.]|jgi:membrane protease YdiL (CAAX protease family)